MRGFPQQLATKQDYINCLGIYPEETKRLLRGLVAGRFTWETSKELTALEEGIEDETHRVIHQQKIDENTGNPYDSLIQLERKEDKNARLFQLGFTVKEVFQLL